MIYSGPYLHPGVMSIRRAGLLLLCAVLAVTRARRSSPEQEDVQEKINSARCTSRCLTLHMTQLTAAFRHLQSDQVLVWCENHRRCAQCLQPCKELWETRKMLSPKSCEKQTECVTSREFLASLRSSRQGDCPPPQRATGFAAACVESCSSDPHCPSPRKCCSNGCGHTCQAPANLYKGVPLKPRREMSFVEDSEGHVKVLWVSKFNVSVEPVVYMLQSRWNIGIHPSEDHASLWTTVAMTLSEDVVLSDLRPQRWYQFRVAAINSHGSRGFTTPSKHYISSKDPSPPEPPINIRVSNQTMDWTGSQPGSHLTERSRGNEVTVAVLIRWEPPREGDLPVHNYRVTWMSRHKHTAHKHTHSLQAHTHTVHNNMHTHLAHSRTPEQGKKESNSRVTQGAQCELWLQGLLPATSYFLSVQTVAYWGQKRLKSPRSQIVFTTVTHTGEDFSNELPSSSSSSSSSSSLPSSPSLSSSSPSSSDLPLSSSLPHPESPLNPVTPGDLRLEVAAPHYHNDQLQVKVFWKWSYHARQRHPGPYILRWRPHTCSANVTSTERTTTVQGTHHTITGLLFACKYRVTVALKTDPGSEAVAWVTTPTCSSITVRGGKTLPCNTEERLLAGRKVVLRPERLTADFKQVNGTLLTTFRWRMSQHALEPAAVEGFQFTWTMQSGITMATEGQEDTLISQTQTIAPSQRSVIVQGLQGDSVYQLQLQVLTAGGSNGAAVSKTIHTPVIDSTL
ncbi:anosmin-1b [Thunnus albacares]|uniref:anosmin-1b n=1 Tax=Thunnus albacares TaxID=8236 RepID=UPI001CF61ECB|nr:anosmin-1b [Thunnus albacares]